MLAGSSCTQVTYSASGYRRELGAELGDRQRVQLLDPDDRGVGRADLARRRAARS